MIYCLSAVYKIPSNPTDPPHPPFGKKGVGEDSKREYDIAKEKYNSTKMEKNYPY